MKEHDRRVVEGFKLPSTAPFSQNERDWIDMLRQVAGDSDPPLTMAGVQALRAAVSQPRGEASAYTITDKTAKDRC